MRNKPPKINLDGLEVGMLVKNYKELCEKLGLKVKGGNAKVVQLRWVRRIITYERQGISYLIKDIDYDSDIGDYPQWGGDRSDSEHIEMMERLLLDLMANSGDRGVSDGRGDLLISKTRLFQALSMTSVSYGHGSGNMDAISEILDVDYLLVREWYSSVNGMLTQAVRRTLESLTDKSLILWDNKITVYKEIKIVDKNGHTHTESWSGLATREEARLVLELERKVLEDMGCAGKRVLAATGRWSEFQTKLNNELRRRSDICYTWMSYDIIFNPKDINSHREELQKRSIESKEKRQLRGNLNSYLAHKAYVNAQNRRKAAIEEREKSETVAFGTSSLTEKEDIRMEDKYLEDINTLNENLITSDAKSLSHEIYKYREEKSKK